MLSSSLDTLLKVSKTTYTKILFAYDCVTLYMFLKPANSDTENDIKKNKKCPLKKSCTAKTGEKKWKRHFLKCTRIQFFISKRPTFLKQKTNILRRTHKGRRKASFRGRKKSWGKVRL